MPTERISVDPEGIMRAGNGISSAGQVINQELMRFQGELASFGEPWGNDDIGSLIGTVYGVISDLAFETYAGNADEVQEIGALTQQMGQNYADNETGIESGINAYKQILGG
jgi:hypothetical protein